jgi:pimeloyl-ACP methyl ester carboxylesterase
MLSLLSVLQIGFLLWPLLFTQSVLAGPEGMWKPEDMTETENLKETLPSTVKHLVARMDGISEPTPAADCGEDECFKLYFFTNRAFNKEDGARKNILFISGGPGQVVRPGSPLTAFLEETHNVVYFLLRGVGLSTIPPENRYDKFLRARYVVGDIERLRSEILGPGKKWDAVYGFSYGTVVAQHYAKQMPGNLRRLILLSPVVRYRSSAVARRERMIRTLDEIYRFVRSEECNCTTTDIKVPFKFLAQSEGFGPVGTIDPGDNFCFLDASAAPTEDLIRKIKSKVKDVYEKVEDEYGALGFVTENWKKLHTDDDYRDLKKEFEHRFPYPQEFFIALKQLQGLDSPGNPKSFLVAEDIIHMVDAASILGYYATLDEETLRDLAKNDFPCCDEDASFFGAVTCHSGNPFVKRVKKAKDRLLQHSDGGESRRALYVFGVSDGMHPWLPGVLKESGIQPEKENCPTGEELKGFIQGSGEKYKLLRKETAKIGIVPNDLYCLWNPSFPADVPDHRPPHEVETLVVKGAADAVTAGCQAEEFFASGLATGKRILIEFPGKGHQPLPPMNKPPLAGGGPTEWAKDYSTVFNLFMTKAVPEFRQHAEVQKALEALGGVDITEEVAARLRNCLN